jgi:RNA polymerase sigma-70 factor (ECF subfamily)
MGELELPDALRDEMRAAWHRYLDMLLPLRPALHAYCRRLTRDVWEAEDLVQDALLKGFGTLGSLHQQVANPRAYLLRIATHLWIDTLRRRESEARALAASDAPQSQAPADRVAVGEAGARLMQHLPPRERAAVVLKDVFDLSLEEAAEVLETTIGAIKAALHRGRERLRAADEEAAPPRPAPSRDFVDRFVELFNRADKAGLLALMIDNGSTENVGTALHYGTEAHRGPRSWFQGALGGHPEWPEWFRRYESRRAACAVYQGEPLVLLHCTRQGEEAVEAIVRLDEEEGRLARLRSYAFCPETMRAVCEELGVPVRTGIYRYPTPAPGKYYGEAR